MNDDCRRIGIERCGTDVTCALCGKQAEDLAADSTLEQPYYDIDGNEGTLDEVQSS